MLKRVIESFLREYRTHRMARFAVWVFAYGAALGIAERFAPGVRGLLWLVFWAFFVVVCVYGLVRLGGLVWQRLLWRLRRRLIVTYLFIAVVPILLIVLLVGIRDFIVSGQFASFLVASKLQEHADKLRQLDRAVAHVTHEVRYPTPEALLDGLQRTYVQELSTHAASYPGLAVTIRLGSVVRAFYLDGRPLERPFSVPAWLRGEEFAGIVIDQGEIDLRAVDRSETPWGELDLILSQPLNSELLDIVGADIGPVMVIAPRSTALHLRSQAGAARRDSVQGGTIRSKIVSVPPPVNFADFTVVGASTLEPILWGGGREERLAEPLFVSVTTRIFTLNSQILATLGRFSRIYVTALWIVAAVFLVIELFSLVIGVRLTRSITTTVDKLYDATERVKAGDFTYRINFRARDQLSALGESFDNMTTSVERLLRESQEKSRLDSEIEIAREVQRQLFPRSPPRIPGFELYGICKPARSVSGDYYDFLVLGENRVGLVVGDVSGKGIFAAMLMAAIQSAIRAQLYDGLSPSGISGAAPISTAEVVARLNRQLFENTPAERYATFFYAVYDGKTRMLTYTNAGHLPPLIFRRGGIERLKTGGTVVGLFSPLTYEQAEVELQPGDLVLAFTDGVTEPENHYGEEFGEPRVIEVVRRAMGTSPEALVEEVYRSVADWTGSPELQDDMTMVVAKAVA